MASTAQRGAIYVRVSTRGQEQDATSLETQETACRAVSDVRGIYVEERHVYREVHSGAELWERPALTSLRAAMRAGEIDVVMAYAVDRLSREQHHLGLIVSEAEKYAVRLDFATEKWDETPQGKFMRGALSFMAEMEREKIKERTMRGKRARVTSGNPLPGGRALFGYRWNEDRTALLIDEVEADVVRFIFKELACGSSLRKVAEILTRRGVPLPNGQRVPHNLWHNGTIRRMVQHPAYWGEGAGFRYRVEQVTVRNPETGVTRKVQRVIIRPTDEQVPLPGAYPAIVSRELAMQVQERLAFNRTNLRRRVQHEDTLLNGFVKCGYCGGRMEVHRLSPKGHRSPEYRCSRRVNRPLYPCRHHTIATSILDAKVWHAVDTALHDKELLQREREKLRTADPVAANLTSCDGRLAAIAKDQANLAENAARLSGSAADPLLEKLTKLDEEKRKIEVERKHLLHQRALWQAKQDLLLTLEQDQAQELAASELDRELTRDEKRNRLHAVELEVLVYRADDPEHDRYEIKANIPLHGAIDSNVETFATRVQLPPRFS